MSISGHLQSLIATLGPSFLFFFCRSRPSRPSSPRPALESARENEEKPSNFSWKNNPLTRQLRLPIIFKSQVITFFPIHTQNDEISSIYLFQHSHTNTHLRQFSPYKQFCIYKIDNFYSQNLTLKFPYRPSITQSSIHVHRSTHERSKFSGAERCIIRLSYRIVEKKKSRLLDEPLLLFYKWIARIRHQFISREFSRGEGVSVGEADTDQSSRRLASRPCDTLDTARLSGKNETAVSWSAAGFVPLRQRAAIVRQGAAAASSLFEYIDFPMSFRGYLSFKFVSLTRSMRLVSKRKKEFPSFRRISVEKSSFSSRPGTGHLLMQIRIDACYLQR